VYVGSWDRKLYAMTAEGQLKWNFSTGDKVFGLPALGPDGTVYVGSEDHKLYAVTAEGQLKWSFPTGGHKASLLPRVPTENGDEMCPQKRASLKERGEPHAASCGRQVDGLEGRVGKGFGLEGRV
jgi:hypothetical protein